MGAVAQLVIGCMMIVLLCTYSEVFFGVVERLMIPFRGECRNKIVSAALGGFIKCMG